MGKLIFRLLGFIGFLLGLLGVGGLVLLVSLGVIDLRQMFPALPEPPEIDTKGLPSIGEQRPDIVVDIPDFAQLPPGETVTLDRAVKRRPLTSTIPAPQQLVTDPRVVGTNVFLAIVMAIVFGGSATMLNNMLRDEEVRIQAWLKAYGVMKPLEWLRGLFAWTMGGRVRQGCLTLPFIALILATYGIVFAFLEEGMSIFTREGVFLAVGMAFSVGLISFAGDVARRLFAWLWREKSSFNLYPANLLVAVITVGLSRLLSLTPGLVFGTPGGAELKTPLDDFRFQRRSTILALTTLGAVVLFGGIGWTISGFVLTVLQTPIRAEIAGALARLLAPLQNTGLLLFLVAMETLFFESLPLAYGEGRTIFQSSKLLWAILFVPVAFLFNHTLLNPQSAFLDSFLTANVKVLWVTIFGLVGFTGGLWFYFNVLDDVLREWVGIRLPE